MADSDVDTIFLDLLLSFMTVISPFLGTEE